MKRKSIKFKCSKLHLYKYITNITGVNKLITASGIVSDMSFNWSELNICDHT